MMAFKRKMTSKNILLAVIGVLLIVIFTLIASFYPFSIQITNGAEVSNGQIVVTDEVVETTQFLYKSLSGEYAGCLEGAVFGNVTKITKFYETEITHRDEDSVQFKQCQINARYIGTIHSHPQTPGIKQSDLCRMSIQDSFTFGNSHDSVMCIHCGDSEMVCYTRQNLKGIKVLRE